MASRTVLEREQTWTIAQIAEEFAITHRAVRHYEELGLISPSGAAPSASITAAIAPAWP